MTILVRSYLLLLLLSAILITGAPGDAKGAPLIINGLDQNQKEPDGLRFLIKEDGLYRMEGDDVLLLADLSEPIPSSSVSLFSSEGEEYLLLEDEGDGLFGNGSGDHLLFYGEYPRGGTVTTRRNFNISAPYWLVFDTEAAAHLSSRLERATSIIDIHGAKPVKKKETSTPLRYQRWNKEDARQSFVGGLFYDTVYRRMRLEVDYFYKRWLGAREEDSDFYWWAPISTALDRERWKPRRPPVAERFAGAKVLESERYNEMKPEIRLKLMSDSKAKHGDGIPDHLLQTWIASTQVGELAYDGQGMKEWSAQFPAELIDDKGRVNLELVMPEERLELVDRVNLDWLEIGYPARPGGWKDDQDWVSTEGMTAAENGAINLYTQGWKTDQVRLLDPTLGRIYEPTHVKSRSGRDWNIGFLAELPHNEISEDADPYNEMPGFLLFGPEASKSIELETVEKWKFIDPLKEISDSPEHAKNLIITHRVLGEAPYKLAKRRNDQGLPSTVVEIDTLFDFYTAGYHSKQALKQLVNEIEDSGGEISYVTLFGDSSFDFKAIQARYKPERRIAGVNLLPLHYYDARHTTRPVYPADHLFISDPEDVDRPRASIGRIPAASEKEATAYFNKIVEYETSGENTPEWQKRALLVSSWERSFKNLLEDVKKSSIATLNTELLIADINQVEENVNNFETSLNEGCGVVYYVGHGGAFVWRVGPVDFSKQKDLFTGENIGRLENSGRYPLVFVSSCYTTSFDHARSLGEEFLLTADRGAIAVVGSPWKTSVSPNHRFNKAMMGYLFDTAERARLGGDQYAEQVRLGDAFYAVKKKKLLRGDSQIGFTLLGDPTLLVQVPVKEKAGEPEVAEAREAATEAVTEENTETNQ